MSDHTDRLLLSDAERRRFADYCRRTADTSNAIIEQMRLAHFPEVMQRREKTLAAAYTLVAEHIGAAETHTIHSEATNAD